jgi:hypothetical protein
MSPIRQEYGVPAQSVLFCLFLALFGLRPKNMVFQPLRLYFTRRPFP